MVEKSLMNCPLLDLKNLRENRMLCSHLQTLLCGQFIADFLVRKTELLFIISTIPHTTENCGNEILPLKTKRKDKKKYGSTIFAELARFLAEIDFRRVEKKQNKLSTNSKEDETRFELTRNDYRNFFFDFVLLISTVFFI